MVPVFKNVGEMPTIKNYSPVILPSVFSNTLKTPENNSLVDHLEKYDLFSDFQYGLMSSCSAVDLLTVVPARIAGAFNRATRIIALDISNVFDWVWHAGLLHKLKSYGHFKVGVF